MQKLLAMSLRSLLCLNHGKNAKIGVMTLSIMTLNITKFSVITLSIRGLFVTLSISVSINDTKHNNALSYDGFLYAECHYAECCYAECCGIIKL